MKLPDITEVVKKTQESLSKNLEANNYNEDQIKLLVDSVPNILWFATDVQGNVIISSEDYYKASNLYMCLKRFMEV